MPTILNGIWWIMRPPILLEPRRQPGRLLPFLLMQAVKKIKIVYRIKTATGTPDSAFLPATVLLTSASSGVSGDSAADGTISNKLRSVTINVVNESGKPTDELNGTNDANTPVVGGTLEAVLECAATAAAECEVSNYNFTWQMADAGTPDKFTDLNNTNAEKHKYIIKGTEQNKLFRVHVTPKTTKATPENKRAYPSLMVIAK